MLTYLTTPVRAALLAAALLCPIQLADARHTAADQPQTATARTTARTKGDAGAPDRGEVTVGGVLMIVGIVSAVIFLAWVCSRIGDNRRTMMM